MLYKPIKTVVAGYLRIDTMEAAMFANIRQDVSFRHLMKKAIKCLNANALRIAHECSMLQTPMLAGP